MTMRRRSLKSLASEISLSEVEIAVASFVAISFEMDQRKIPVIE
jgi:hypothetical protein